MNPGKDQSQATLTLHMEGLAGDGGDLKFGVFIDKLDSLKSALHEIDRSLNGIDKRTVDFFVSDLTHCSPAAVTVKATPIDGGIGHQLAIFNYFSTVVSGLTTNSLEPVNANYYLLEKVAELCSGYGDRFSRMWLSQNQNTVAVFDERTRANVLSILGKTIYSLGAVKGKLERYNSHGDVKYFYLYPMLGDKVKCVFDEDLLADAATAVEKNVTVTGRLKYHERQFFPYEVIVEKITINPDDGDLPTMSSMLGAAPQATGDQASEDFIKDHRDGWH